jgi:arylsulfatase A-like enzyme
MKLSMSRRSPSKGIVAGCVSREGIMFTDYYAEQSCTAGRASFITGPSSLRTGLTKVGLPGAKGYKVGDTTYKVHLDGDNLVPYLTGQAAKSPLESFFYINDDQQLTGLRYDNWKLVFMEQRAPGTMLIWANPFTTLRPPKIFNLRTDPYECADITSNTYYDWLIDFAFLFVPAQGFVGQFLMTSKVYPQRQKADSFNMDAVLQNLQESGGSK